MPRLFPAASFGPVLATVQASIQRGLGRVWLPFLLSRCLVLLVIGLYQLRSQGTIQLDAAVLARDGNWFADIALRGYGFQHADTGQTPLPFFPLFPLLLWLSHGLGLPIGIAGSLINQLGLLVGLSLVGDLASHRLDPAALRCGLWLMAFFPGTATFSLCYSDGLFLALSCAALLSQGLGGPRLAGTLAAAASLTRPNGLITALALTGQGLQQRSPRRTLVWLLLPSLAALLGWSLWLWQRSGHPLAWIQAKQAWREMSLFEALQHPSHFPWVDLALAIAFLAIVILYRRHWPLSWTLFGLLCVLPSLLTGLTGMPRYLVSCFPAFLGLGLLLGNRPSWWTLGLLTLSSLKLATATLNIVSLQRTP